MNLIVVVIGSYVLGAMGVSRGNDVTADEDFELEVGDAQLKPAPAGPAAPEADKA